MRFSLRLNNDLPVALYPRLAAAAERAGFDQIWVSHDLFLRSAPPIVSAMLAGTERLHCGIGILNPYSVHPAEIAMLGSTLDEASGNRFLLGLGAGAGDFLEWIGVEQTSPLGAVRESIEAIRRLQAGGVPPSGKTFRFTQGAYLRFEAPRRTPIYVGAMGPRMLRLTGELADGALPLLFPPEHYGTVAALIAEGEAERSSDLEPLDLAACVWVSISDDRAAARRALAEKIAYYGASLSPLIQARLGLEASDWSVIERTVVEDRDLPRAAGMVDERMMRIGVAGTVDQVVERLTGLVDLGATHLSFGPPLGPDVEASVRLLGEALAQLCPSS